METFKAETFPLSGQRLIEASAGTGKTYNIANLYLRLLIGDGEPDKARTVQQILVVTFTRAATGELRGRIRHKIEQALCAFRDAETGGKCEEPFIAELVRKNLRQLTACARLLEAALQNMDEASIYTIHGFAVRSLQTFLFETGALADIDISEATDHRRDQLLANLWRALQFSESPRVQSFFESLNIQDIAQFKHLFGRNIDAGTVKPSFLLDEIPELANLEEAIRQVEIQYEKQANEHLCTRKSLLDEWNKFSTETVAADFFAKLSAISLENSKRKTDPEPVITGYIKDCLSATALKPDNPFKNKNQSTQRLQLLLKQEPDHPLCQFMTRLLNHIVNTPSEEGLKKSVFSAFLLQFIAKQLGKPDFTAMQLDDVVKHINRILLNGGEQAARLKKAVTVEYPVCMVDEFQDTDPAQFTLFNQLYEGNDAAAFFMIGDPKQSIYQFRGADIFAYLQVRKKVELLEKSRKEASIFSLHTNFRSKAKLVQAVNSLFSETKKVKENVAFPKNTFLFPGIDYVEVASCEEMNPPILKPEYQVNHPMLTNSPLVFVGDQVEPDSDLSFSKNAVLARFAKDAAQRISVLLSGCASLKSSDNSVSSLKGGDIAVLVRTGVEAAFMREALLSLETPLQSVYQSQRDSVFNSSVIAEDLYHIICAMNEPREKRLIKKALATLLFRGFSTNFTELEQLDDDEKGDALLERLIIEFSEYQLSWHRYGILSAINHFILNRNIMTEMAKLPDCDRLVTDIRHIGELLQNRDAETGSHEQLILWLQRQLKDDSDLDEDVKRIRLESDEDLVKIVTIHVSKGLEYPVVFLPFFFLPRKADTSDSLPSIHPAPDYKQVIDYVSLPADVVKQMQHEMLAEDMRLLYVALTRAINQCYVGIASALYGASKTQLFPMSVWAHLLEMDENHPGAEQIRGALVRKFSGRQDLFAFQPLFDCQPETPLPARKAAQLTELMDEIIIPEPKRSNWVITSYTALAHSIQGPGLQYGGFDEVTVNPLPVDSFMPSSTDEDYANDIRYRLMGSNRTGNFFHSVFESLALSPDRYLSGSESAPDFKCLLQQQLRINGIDIPEIDAPPFFDEVKMQRLKDNRLLQISDWIQATLGQPLFENDESSTLRKLFDSGACLPEMNFDFAIGNNGREAHVESGINRALASMTINGVFVPAHQSLTGFITGSMDLLFIHNKKVYVLDYKSNTLGKSPRFYDEAAMRLAMREHRYDLQAAIYSVAAHRYMKHRLQQRYHFDNGEFSFGGVLYLFLRGMGLSAFPRNGIYFSRPQEMQVVQLDDALSGRIWPQEAV
ncbi:MAG: exodeoxyribonuclease V subunit beta [Pseudomonadales bacterium]|nr:exodeoxyribonuclease V subunit beta [Pseudomonadales bacterium]